jgi:hypothetical protein
LVLWWIGLEAVRLGLHYAVNCFLFIHYVISDDVWFGKEAKKGRLNGFCGVFIGVWSTLFIFYPRCVFQHFALPPSTDEACLKIGIRILIMWVGDSFVDGFYKNLNKSYG